MAEAESKPRCFLHEESKVGAGRRFLLIKTISGFANALRKLTPREQEL